MQQKKYFSSAKERKFALITGSRNITCPGMIPVLLKCLFKRGFNIIVGDAPGVDRLVVETAIEKGYGHRVTVVGAYGRCRNIQAFGSVARVIKLNSTYLARNLYMVGLSQECYAIWDGKSRGTQFTFQSARRAGLYVAIFYETEGGEKKLKDKNPLLSGSL